MYLKNFAREDHSKNQCYIRHIAPKTHLECYIAVRCDKCIVNNETRWRMQVNSAKISLLTEVFA